MLTLMTLLDACMHVCLPAYFVVNDLDWVQAGFKQAALWVWCVPHRSKQAVEYSKACTVTSYPCAQLRFWFTIQRGACAGQTVLVLGAAGGVGVAAVQISKVLGAKVVAVARGESKAKLLKDLGADAVIDTSASHQVRHVAGSVSVVGCAWLTVIGSLSSSPCQAAFMKA